MIKTILVIIALALSLVGCFETLPAKKEIVIVEKPVPFIPKPPEVPKFTSEVDKLTAEDIKDPGKVGQAYKHDMTALRKLQVIYELILDQYRQSSENFDQINMEIDKLFKHIPGATDAPAK